MGKNLAVIRLWRRVFGGAGPERSKSAGGVNRWENMAEVKNTGCFGFHNADLNKESPVAYYECVM